MPGGLFVLLLILYTTYRVLRGRSGTTWLHMLLALGAIIAFSFVPARPVLMIVGVAAAVIGGILILIEQRRAKPTWNQSQGVFMLGLSALLFLSILAVPMINELLAGFTDGVVATAQDSASVVGVQPTATTEPARPVNASAESSVLVTNTPAPTLTPAAVEITLANPLPTRYIFSTAMATNATTNNSTNVVTTPVCEGVVQNNLNFRAAPVADAELIATIPHSTDLSIIAENEDGSWLYAKYQNESGWVSAAYVILNSDCGDLPVQDS